MAAPSLSTFSLYITLFTLYAVISPSLSLTCSSQKLATTKVYANCSDLPKLGATLHYTFDAANSSLDIAFVATPTSGGAWVSWAVNPTATGMVGSQALIALKLTDGSVAVKTYNVSSYKSIVESKLSFDVWNLSATEASGVFTIFATIKVPEKATALNQVWQVGGVVNGGRPGIHPLQPDNKESIGVLSLVASKTAGNGTVSAPAPAPKATISAPAPVPIATVSAPAPAPVDTVSAPAPAPSGSDISRSNMALFFALFLLVSSVIAF